MDKINPYPEIVYGVPLGEEEELTLLPFRYEEKDNHDNCGHVSLFLYCFNKRSDSIFITINNFPVYCCIELPAFRSVAVASPDGDFRKTTYVDGSKIIWDDDLAYSLFNTIVAKINDTNLKKNTYHEKPIDYTFSFKRDIYYYNNTNKPYLYIYFRTLKGRADFNNLINYPIYLKGEGYVKLKTHENKISCFRRLMSIKDIKYAQWFTVKGKFVPTNSPIRLTKKYCTEYIVDYKTMTPIDLKETTTWEVYPKIFSWDIETYSKNHRQMPISTRRSDCIFIISITFQFRKKPETRRKYSLVLGQCDHIEGSEVIRFSSEKELLYGFCHMFDYLDPDILTGYNTDTYDWKYLIDRFERNDVQISKIPNTGRLLKDESRVYKNIWQSSGAGSNTIIYLYQSGRDPSFDMLKNIKRIYKLRMYSLEFVSQHFLKEGKNDVKPKDMFLVYEDSIKDNVGVEIKNSKGELRRIKMKDIVEYCIQDSLLPIKLMDKTNIWYHLLSLANVAGVSINDLVTRGEQIRCYSNIADKCHKQNTVLSNPNFYDYYFKGGYVGNPIVDVHEVVFTLDFTSLYPSIMQAYNLSMDSLIQIPLWKYIPESYCNIITFTQEEPIDKYSSSYLNDLKDKYNLYIEIDNERKKAQQEGREYVSNCTITFTQDDYECLKNMSLFNPKKDFTDIEYGNEDIFFEPDDLTNVRIVNRRYEFRFIKKEIYEGIMPKLEREWVASRKEVKKMMKVCEKKLEKQFDENIESERIVHNAHQNCIKIVANSGYGFCGVKDGMLPCVFVAICVTALGRRLISMANNKLEEEFSKYDAKVVYNDTDSSMVSLKINVHDPNINLEKIANDMEECINGRPEKIIYNEDGSIKETIPEIKGIFEDPLKMECENCSQMCTLKPKYYLKLIRNMSKKDIEKHGEFKKDHNGEYEIIQKGVLTSKKGNAAFANIVYKDLSNKTLFKFSIQDKLYALNNFISNILNGKFSARELARVTTVGGSYTSETYYMVTFINYLISKGSRVMPGEKLEYIIVNTRDKNAKIGEKCREINMWEDDENREEIDYLYYIEHGLEEQYDFLFYAGCKKIIDDPDFASLGYQPQFSRCQFVHLRTPIKMIVSLIKDYTKLDYNTFYTKAYEFCCFYGIQFDVNVSRFKYISYFLEIFIKKICYVIDMKYPNVISF